MNYNLIHRPDMNQIAPHLTILLAVRYTPSGYWILYVENGTA